MTSLSLSFRRCRIIATRLRHHPRQPFGLSPVVARPHLNDPEHVHGGLGRGPSTVNAQMSADGWPCHKGGGSPSCLGARTRYPGPGPPSPSHPSVNPRSLGGGEGVQPLIQPAAGARHPGLPPGGGGANETLNDFHCTDTVLAFNDAIIGPCAHIRMGEQDGRQEWPPSGFG